VKFDEFGLERWLLREAEIGLGGGGVSKLALGDLVAGLDLDQPLRYGRTDGSDYLKGLVAEWYGVEPGKVLITSGTSEANLLVNLTLLEPGDDYVTEVPMYEQTVGVAKALGCRVEDFHLREKEGWRPDIEGLKEAVSSETRIVFLDNPNNPTGALLEHHELRAICEITGDVGAWVHCDNALRGSELDGVPGLVPFPEWENSVVTGSVSKLGATSPRIGWVIGPEELVERCWVAKDYTTLGHSGLGEVLAGRILGMREALVERNLGYSRESLEVLSKWVDSDPHLSWMEPKSGFTGFPAYDYDIDSVDFCEGLLQEEGVLLSPGAFFGVEGHLRICMGVPADTLREGLGRVDAFMGRLG
jgi:aspartate/methionine/tyrosine aminotransferase